MDQPIEWVEPNGYAHPVIEQAKLDEFRLRISYDDSGMTGPREWDNATVMVCDHPRYNLGDRKLESDEEEALNRGGWPLLVRYLKLCKGAVAVQPLWLYDHSGISISTGQVDVWDSGQIGFVMVTKETMEITGVTAENAAQAIKDEVETYDQYLRGEVYGYEVLDGKGEILDSCWGFIGDLAEAKAEAESSARYHYGQKYPIPAERERVGV